MKRVFQLPLLTLPLLFMSCDGQAPTEPDSDATFAKTVPNTVHDYAAQRMNLHYSTKNGYLNVTVAVKNVSVITCGDRMASVAIHYRPCCGSGTLNSVGLVYPVCDEPAVGEQEYSMERHSP